MFMDLSISFPNSRAKETRLKLVAMAISASLRSTCHGAEKGRLPPRL